MIRAVRPNSKRLLILSLCLQEKGGYVSAMLAQTHAIEEAARAGFDLSLLEENLALTPEQRAYRHDQALALVLELDRIREERHANTQPSAPAAR
ncbi:MAG: hypothetical protein QM790_16270 [Nibricoccus sp.]